MLQICRPMTLKHEWHNQTFWLSGQRLMYWEERKTLVASDLHLGKSGHFRKSGIAIPQQVMQQDLIRLFDQIQFFKPERLLVVGDLFHSHSNKEMEWFARWRNDLSWLKVLLVKGNHDVLPDAWFEANNIDLATEWKEEGIHFIHEPVVDIAYEQPLITGHIHPGIRVEGVARQSLRLPCFYFAAHQCILPAFGLFTGTYPIKPKKKDVVFAIADKTVIPIR
jgi:DNA ligase-associated metallophosphoesterase